MADKQIIIDCKYKFQNNEKFEGKPYCTLHNELCEDLSFVCDDNCQVYEDYKQLKAQFEVQKEVYEQRIEEDKQIILAYDNDLRCVNTKLEKIQDIVSDELNLKFDVTGKLQEIKEIIGEQ